MGELYISREIVLSVALPLDGKLWRFVYVYSRGDLYIEMVSFACNKLYFIIVLCYVLKFKNNDRNKFCTRLQILIVQLYV